MIMSSLLIRHQDTLSYIKRAEVNSLLSSHVYTLLVDTTCAGCGIAAEEGHFGKIEGVSVYQRVKEGE